MFSFHFVQVFIYTVKKFIEVQIKSLLEYVEKIEKIMIDLLIT